MKEPVRLQESSLQNKNDLLKIKEHTLALPKVCSFLSDIFHCDDEEGGKWMIQNINWYPGHMKKTRELIQENLKAVDLVIELLDSRIPISSPEPVVF